MDHLYSKKVLENFMHPQNIGAMKNPSGEAVVGNPRCGDVAKYYIKVKTKKIKGKDTEYVADVKVETLGCGAAIATSSMATQMIMGKPLREAIKLTNQAIADALQGLPPVKMHCSVLAAEGIKKAIENYQHNKKKN